MSDENSQVTLHKVTYEITVTQNLVPEFYDLIPAGERTAKTMVESDIQDYLKGAMTLEELLGSYINGDDDVDIQFKKAERIEE